MIDTSKIIHAPVGGGRYTVTAPIVKEDYGLYLKIEGLELPSTYEVDFSNSEHNGTSVTMIGNADGVLIPSQFISSGKDVFAFLYHVGADYGRTVYKFRIPNKLRPDRTEETPTPEDQSVIDQAISALNEAVAQTAQDVIDADASAQSASADADRAEEARTDAQNYATQAEQSVTDAHEYASQASASATASANSASQSAQIKSDVEGMVDDAQGYANEAKGYATQASNYADNAQGHANTARGYATSASESAGTATSKASEASGYAQTASQKATEAGGYADTSSQKASESAQSASLALGYKNDALQAKTDAETAQANAEQARDDAQTAQELAETAESNAESTVHGVLDSLDLVETSGSIVETHDAFPVSPEKMVVDINPVQNLNGYDHPWVGGGGLNKVPLFESETVNDVTLTNNNGEITLNGTATADAYFDVDVNILVPSGSTFYLCCFNPVATDSRVSLFAITDNGNPQKNMNVVNGMTTTTATADTTISKFRLCAPIGVTLTDFKCSPMLQIGGTAPTVFSPYENICPISGWAQVNVNHSDADMTNPTTVTINLGQTVYGGTLDVLSGVLRADRAMVDMGTLNWLKSSATSSVGGSVFSKDITTLNPPMSPRSRYTENTMLSDQFKTGDSDIWFISNLADYEMFSNETNIYISASDYDTAMDFKSAMNGVQLCYELAIPITIQLTPQQITLFKDYNALWADTGDISEFAYRTGEFATKADIPNVPVEDVQINGTSIVNNGVANIPMPKTVTVTGTTPTITAQADTRYVCGEVSTLDLTLPSSGIVDVVFESGATATVLTITGTVKWANGFDPTSLDANTTYEINIMDGLGVACAWT